MEGAVDMVDILTVVDELSVICLVEGGEMGHLRWRESGGMFDLLEGELETLA
jgi:hypothetical protein